MPNSPTFTNELFNHCFGFTARTGFYSMVSQGIITAILCNVGRVSSASEAQLYIVSVMRPLYVFISVVQVRMCSRKFKRATMLTFSVGFDFKKRNLFQVLTLPFYLTTTAVALILYD